VPLRLGQDVLRPDAELLRLDDAKDSSIGAERVVGGTAVGRILLDGAPIIGRQWAVRIVAEHVPPGGLQHRVDALLPGGPLGLVPRPIPRPLFQTRSPVASCAQFYYGGGGSDALVPAAVGVGKAD